MNPPPTTSSEYYGRLVTKIYKENTVIEILHIRENINIAKSRDKT